MVPSEEKLYSLGRRCVYIFNRRKAKKEIPDDKHLVAEEIKTPAEFYESPVGQSFVKVQPRLISESLPVVVARLRPIAGLVFQELVEEFPELGIPSNEVMVVGNLRVINIACITYPGFPL